MKIVQFKRRSDIDNLFCSEVIKELAQLDTDEIVKFVSFLYNDICQIRKKLVRYFAKLWLTKEWICGIINNREICNFY